MIPPAFPANWNFDEAGQWLSRHPDAMEPGLRLLDRGFDLGHGLSVPLCGVDSLGRPCLILHSEKFSAHFFNQLLEIVARMTGDGARFQPLFPRPTEPRVFLLASNFDRDVRQRLALLAKAFPLRLFLLLPPLDTETAPQLVPEPLEEGVDSVQLLADLSASAQPLAARLLCACAALRPTVGVQSNCWPLVLQGRHGPCATLFWDQEQLWFAATQEHSGVSPLMLDNDAAVDCAIDTLMRSQGNRVSPAA